ncbi:alpha/beta hydrolase family protein [Daejeonella sp. JGW-45]|uniref:alpha/beta hydrolase n=1 Tax=Daejeonella sp. JGW-45 TaxID=3034148 RepID=UPI0023EABD96|nr:alpha/beta hydrolase family protein [Daejeonella sp. JGW-45]
MKRNYLAALTATLLISGSCFYSEPSSAQETLWKEQTPWEGVPEPYQKWKFPDFNFPSSLAAWTSERKNVESTLVKLLGDIPARPRNLKVETVFKKQMNGYTIEKLLIDNGVDSRIPAYLAIPTNVRGKVPVILSMHGHGSSKDNIFGSSSTTAQDVLALLISKGYAVMAIDSYFNGERRGTGPAGERETQARGADQENSLFKMNLWFGRSLWGMQLRDEQIALDYLNTRQEIDSERIGAQGMSMGSTRAWWLAAIDKRVKAVVGVACFTRYEELIAQRELKAHGIYYFVPGMLKHFDTEAVMGLLAPRPFLALTGDSDAGSPLSGMRTLEKKLGQVYSLYKEQDKFRSIIYPNTGHVYTDDMKIEMVEWFGKYL